MMISFRLILVTLVVVAGGCQIMTFTTCQQRIVPRDDGAPIRTTFSARNNDPGFALAVEHYDPIWVCDEPRIILYCFLKLSLILDSCLLSSRPATVQCWRMLHQFGLTECAFTFRTQFPKPTE